ncbi:MAG: DEAD/DEAH box helicase [Candidatus Pacebacteria bacterium]|nr:DEAD/DEAH box helicase [Candidatus Paceibacterota bacterium]
MNKFKDFGLKPEIIKSLEDLGFTEPSAIQLQAIPKVLESGKDLIALAQTGTGKTAAFSLPILEKINLTDKNLQVLILCPTRELCLQISEDIRKMGKYLANLKVVSVYGGDSMERQLRDLRQGPQVVVATPGRGADLIRRKALKLANLKYVVLDEADEMLDMGFKEDLDAILETSSSDRQTLLFSATMSQSVRKIAQKYMSGSQEISVGERNQGSLNVSHKYYVVDGRRRLPALELILASLPGIYGIVFCRTKYQVQDLNDSLKALGYSSEALHGDISQTIRTKIMARFKEKKINLLIATDVAARGIDVDNLTHVINYTLSDQDQAYTHRTGRTGRAQNKGTAISLVSRSEAFKVRRLEKMIGQKFELAKLPQIEEIYVKQVDDYVEKLKTLDISKLKLDDYFQKLAGSLESMSKEELIKRVAIEKLTPFIEASKKSLEKNLTFEPRERGGRSDKRPGKRNIDIKDAKELELNLGKAEGMNIKKFFSLINSSKGRRKVDIGKIRILDHKTFFTVPKGEANYVAKALSGKKVTGKSVKVK